MAHYIDDEIDFAAYMRDTDAKAKVKKAGVWVDSMKKRLRSKATERRILLPWEKSKDGFDFRYGEVTIWGGVNGHGKSLVTSQVALSLMGQDEKVAIASFEMKPMKTLERMARMFAGMNPFSAEFQNEKGLQALDDLYDQFGEWSNNRLWLYDQQGTTDASLVIGMAKYCAKELGIKHLFIDNLAKCVKAEDDYNGQKAFVEELTAIARDNDCHIHIVHHMRKGNKETDPLDKSDFKGSGSIADQPDNLIGVWRNKAKELEAKENKSTKKDEPDATIRVFKQRNYDGNGDGEPLILLWFDRDSWQFLGEKGDPNMCFYNPFPHRYSHA
jgi:twinkle protein